MNSILLSGAFAFLMACSTSGKAPEPIQSAHQPSASTTVKPAPHYGLPLKIYQADECGDDTLVHYEITADGNLRALKPGTESRAEYTSYPLGRQEIKELGDLLKQLDLVAQFDQQTKIPADAMQTEECRMVHKIDLDLDGKMQTIEGGNSRKIQASKSYLAAIDQLKAKLKALAK